MAGTSNFGILDSRFPEDVIAINQVLWGRCVIEFSCLTNLVSVTLLVQSLELLLPLANFQMIGKGESFFS
jgi:hypothetical protein